MEGTRVLDLFAGSGSLGFEALSRGAEGIVFVENDEEAVRFLDENRRQLGCEDLHGSPGDGRDGIPLPAGRPVSTWSSPIRHTRSRERGRFPGCSLRQGTLARRRVSRD